MNTSGFKTKFIRLPFGFRKSISPMFITGNLIASGLTSEKAGIIATYIIDDIPPEGVSEPEFADLVMSYLPDEGKTRFLTLDLMKKFLVSPRSKSPLFMFLGGFTGKTFLTSYVQQHLGINRVTALDDEKYAMRREHPERTHLFKSTYEEPDVFDKTLEDYYPVMKKRIDENLQEYFDKRKWTYFWEGIYFTADILIRLETEYADIDIFPVFLIPPFEQIKERYIIRWMSELGKKYIEENRQQIDRYIDNVAHIREVILRNVEQSPCVILEAEYFDDVLAQYYSALHNKLSIVAAREGVADWIAAVRADRSRLQEYEQFLQKT
ncbi:MAG: hypothetical protein N2691_02860 [Patescibacteria group bacterium]|nr:hypothetical protein [Patescibacteria group bacterium]